MRISVVDDSPMARRFVVVALGHLGHDLAEVEPACLWAVLQALHKDTPDLLILDLQMPTCPGQTLIRACREDPHLKGMKLLLLTAHDEEHLGAFLQRMGQIAYLNKPISPPVLAECVRRLLEAQPELPDTPPPAFRGRVAVVDDSALMRTFIATHLLGRGFEVVEIDPVSLRETLHALLAARPQLVLMDYLMPAFHGDALARAFRAEATEELALAPIVLVTAHQSQELDVLLRALEGIEVFTKPIDPEALMARVEALLA